MDRETDYPYTAKSSFTCKAKSNTPIFSIKGFKNVSKSNDALVAAIAQ